MSRVLETVLTGRNLLSPVLATAARDVANYSSTVTTAQGKASASATTSARAQQAATSQVIAANSRVATSATTTATQQTRAHTQVVTSAQAMAAAEQAASQAVVSANTRLSGAVNGTTATYQRSAASLREKLGLQTLEGSAADRSAAANSRAAASAAVFATAIDRNSTQLAQESVSLGVSTRATQVNATAREQATVAARLQASATGALASSNGMLGSSLTPLTAGLGAVALGLGYAGYRGMEFDAAMSEVSAASGETGATLDRLRQSAVDLGADTKYSSEEAAQGITEMSKAGVSAQNILGGGLKGALSLAAAGQMEVADAAEIGATALNVFNLEGDQMSHVADLLAAGAGKAQGSVYDMGMALNQSALVANAAGLTIEETAGALALFASEGLIGSDAGTSFRQMLLHLQAPSEKSRNLMDSLGVSMYDAKGEFIGMSELAGQLQTQMAGLTQEQRDTAMATIFGADAVRASNILFEAGSTGVDKWAASVNDAGFAADYAAKLQDNLKGDLEKLGGAFDAVMTTMGSGAQGPLREVVQMLTGIVELGGDVLGFWNDLPAPVQTALLAVGGFALLKGPVTDAFHRMQDSVLGWSMANDRADASAGRLRSSLGKLRAATAPLVAITILTSAVSSVMEFSRAGDDARESIKQFNVSLQDMGNIARSDAISDAIDQARSKISDFQKTVDDYDKQGFWDKNLWYVPFGGEKGEVEDARQSLEAYERQLRTLERTNTTATTNTEVLAKRFHLTGQEVQDLADKYEIDLGSSLATTQWRFGALYSQEYGTTPIDAANAMGAAVTSAKEQTEEAIEAQKDWLESLQEVAAGFVDPLGAYQGLLEEKTTAEREAAEKTAASTEDASDSWEDYVDDVDVSLTELADRLQTQIDNQLNWRNNIAQIAQWAGVDVAQHLAQMGEEGVDLVAKMADGSSAEAQRMAGMIRQDIQLGGMAWTSDLDTSMKVMAEIGKQGGDATAKSVADALGLGVIQVADIAAQYGAKIADGINPVLMALGRDQVRTNKRIAGGASLNALGLADGGVLGGGESHVAQIAPAGAWRVWAEPETGGEAYIPLAAGKRGRSLDIWRETGRRLDAPEAQHFAAGGFSSSADVPRPFSTAPYGPPISTAGDAVMQKGFDEVRAWMDANSGANGPIGSGAAGGSWQALWSQVHAQFPTARKTSDYRPGDPGYHGRGKAVDVAGARPGDAAAMLAINRWAAATMGASLAELIYTPGINLYQGKPHTYNAATRADHWDHVHLAAREKGGPVWPGQNFLVGENGPEIARFTAPATVYPNGTSPAAMPGYGESSAGGGAVAIDYDRLATALAKASPPHTTVAVDARGFGADDLAQAIVARQRREEFLTGG